MLLAATSASDAAILIALLIVIIGIPNLAAIFRAPRATAASRRADDQIIARLDELTQSVAALQRQLEDVQRVLHSGD